MHRITHALEHNRSTLYVQPIMHLATREITRHELLLRMIDDDGEIISPAAFLTVAEKFSRRPPTVVRGEPLRRVDG